MSPQQTGDVSVTLIEKDADDLLIAELGTVPFVLTEIVSVDDDGSNPVVVITAGGGAEDAEEIANYFEALAELLRSGRFIEASS